MKQKVFRNLILALVALYGIAVVYVLLLKPDPTALIIIALNIAIAIMCYKGYPNPGPDDLNPMEIDLTDVPQQHWDVVINARVEQIRQLKKAA